MSDDGEDSLPRPKRKIKRVMVLSSASSSDSDDSGPTTSTRKKRLRVLSENDSESSGSVIVSSSRRRRALPKLRDSDADSDTSGWATDHSDAHNLPSTSTSQTNKLTSGFASDSSEGNSDKCSICLMRFTDQEVGTPQNCEHIFCLDCITEWSRNVNTCPVDRITFDSIVVRTCAGGRVLRTEPVKVVERRSSVELLVVEDPTVCEVCGDSSSEETMLLCDGCDHGYHMECIVPRLTEVPIDQWLCPRCCDMFDVIHLSEVNDLFSELEDVDLDALVGPRPSVLRQVRNVRRSSRLTSGGGEGPSTSTGRRGGGLGGGASSSRPAAAPRRRPAPAPTHRARRRKRTRRNTKTVLIEYEVQENGKFPVTKTIKRRVKKRKLRKVPRTAARRTQVRAGVRAQLARLAAGGGAPPALAAPASLAAARYRAGIPALSLFGSAHELDYFSDEERAATGGAAVAARPAAAASARLDNFRQMTRKIMTVPSPPPAASAPDLLSSILESQTLLHSRRAVATISADGDVDIKLPEKKESRPAESQRPPQPPAERVDVRKAAGAAGRQAPAYPGQGRGGGWGGGYRGTYRRDQTSPAYGRQYEPGGPRAHPPPFRAQQRHDDGDRYYPPPRRTPPFPPPDDPYFERRRSEGPRPRLPGPPRPRPDAPPHRHSYGGGFENPLDMRVGPPAANVNPQYMPMREPPAFDFSAQPPAAAPGARSEDERSDPDRDLVIDTEKYDPTEPTNDDDDDSGEEVPAPAPPAPAPPAPLRSASVLDSAVRAVLHEHRLLAAAPDPVHEASDDDEDGDCPNFSIYSATSVHIANHSASLEPLPSPPAPPAFLSGPGEDLADLVQEDASPPPAAPLAAPPLAVPPLDEYSERVSKRCPITSNPRTPIKIKLNTPSLIKRQMSLYDEEDMSADASPPTAPEIDNAPLTEVKESDSPAPPPPSPPPLRLPDEGVLENGTPPREERNESLSKEAAVVDHPDELEEGEEKEDDAGEEEVGEEEASGGRTEVGGSLRPLEKMTESISETEDERSYTPCLDENREASAEPLAGLDTELISEDEGHGDFSEEEEPPRADSQPPPSPPSPPAAERDRKKKKKEAKREGRDRKGKGKRDVVAFKKVSKSGKERNYRERDKKSRRASSESRGGARRRRDKRQDLERYDVRSVVSDKRRRPKDAFGRDVSPPRSASPPASLSPRRRPSGSPRRRPSPSPRRRPSLSPRRRPSLSPRRRPSLSPRLRPSLSPRRRPSLSPRRRPSLSPRRRPSLSPRLRPSLSPRRRPSLSPRRRPSLSPRRRPSLSPRLRPSLSPRRRPSLSPRRRPSLSPRRRPTKSPRRLPTISPRRRLTTSPRRRPSMSPRRRLSISPRKRPSISPRRRASMSPRRRGSASPVRRRGSVSPRRKPSPSPARSAAGEPQASPARRRRGSGARPKRRRRSTSRGRKRRRSASAEGSPKPKSKKKKRATSRARRRSPRRRRRGSASPPPAPAPWAERPASPRTPPAPLPAAPPHRLDRLKHRRQRELPGPSKEVFTSGDNILVSVSFKEQEEERGGEGAGGGRRRRRRLQPDAPPLDAKPVAIIDLDRSPFRELTPSPKHVIVLSDDEGREPAGGAPAAPAAPPPAAAAPPAAPPPAGPKTPPDAAAGGGGAEGGAGAAATPPAPPDSPDAYDPYEPTRSASPPAAAASPPRAPITLEAAQKTNMSADEVIDRRPLSPMEKVLALLASTRDVSPEPPPPPSQGSAAGASPPPAAPPLQPPPALRNPPKLFLAKPSPIKSDPIKPMQQATKISRLPLPAGAAGAAGEAGGGGDSPYSPGSSDFGELFEPRDAFDAIFDKPRHPTRKRPSAKVTPKPKPKKGKTQVDVKLDDDNVKVSEELPSSAVEMQVKTKFLKKLNRQERVVEEVKLVLKPHYNKKHVTKEEYKHILRRAVPKICHNKSGEINPTKIQALVEAYVKKFRKKRKLGLPSMA